MSNVDFIVSLASYNKRIETLHFCLDSLFTQTLKPKKVLLYLDDTVTNLPENIVSFKSKGLEIVQVSSKLKSHNKYFYAFSKYKNDIIITVDDDVIYNNELFYNLIKSYRKFPDSISAARVHYITFDKYQQINPYHRWLFEYNHLLKPSMRLFATGVGGILYPPGIMPKETFNKSEIIELALDADDIWLKFMQIKNNIPVVWSRQQPQHPIQLDGTKVSALYNINRFNNDKYIQSLTSYLKINLYQKLNYNIGG